MYYNCVKFHKNSINSLVGVALTRYMPPPFSWKYKFWTETRFLHAHLQVVYYKYVKFHKNPLSGFGGVALTSYMDGRTDGRMDRVIPIYPPQTLFAGGIIKVLPLSDIGDLSRCWLSCLGPLVYCSQKFKLFGFPIFWFSAYIIKIIPEKCHTTKFDICVFITIL